MPGKSNASQRTRLLSADHSAVEHGNSPDQTQPHDDVTPEQFKVDKAFRKVFAHKQKRSFTRRCYVDVFNDTGAATLLRGVRNPSDDVVNEEFLRISAKEYGEIAAKKIVLLLCSKKITADAFNAAIDTCLEKREVSYDYAKAPVLSALLDNIPGGVNQRETADKVLVESSYARCDVLIEKALKPSKEVLAEALNITIKKRSYTGGMGAKPKSLKLTELLKLGEDVLEQKHIDAALKSEAVCFADPRAYANTASMEALIDAKPSERVLNSVLPTIFDRKFDRTNDGMQILRKLSEAGIGSKDNWTDAFLVASNNGNSISLVKAIGKNAGKAEAGAVSAESDASPSTLWTNRTPGCRSTGGSLSRSF